MIVRDIAELLISLGYKLRETPDDIMARIELKEKLTRIAEDLEKVEL